MTNPLIERLVSVCGIATVEDGRIRSCVLPGSDITADLEHFAALVAEECARVVIDYDTAQCDTGFGPSQNDLADDIRCAFHMPKDGT